MMITNPLDCPYSRDKKRKRRQKGAASILYNHIYYSFISDEESRPLTIGIYRKPRALPFNAGCVSVVVYGTHFEVCLEPYSSQTVSLTIVVKKQKLLEMPCNF